MRPTTLPTEPNSHPYLTHLLNWKIWLWE